MYLYVCIYVLVCSYSHLRADLARAGAGLQLYDGDGCLNRCAVTSHYSPVCGTDYVTYINPSSLLCWKKCHYPGECLHVALERGRTEKNVSGEGE